MATFTHVDRTEANRTMFDDIDEVQRKTKDAIVHMHRDTARAAEAGTSSLEELREQGQRLKVVHNDLKAVSEKLDTAKKSQNRFDFWHGDWFGTRKRAAVKEATAEIAQRNADRAAQSGARSSVLQEVRDRNPESANTTKAAAGAKKQEPKKVIGGPPKSRIAPVASGLTSTSMIQTIDPSQKLNPEEEARMARVRATNGEIDAGLNALGREIDDLGHIARATHQELIHQAPLVEQVARQVEHNNDKAKVVATRQVKIAAAVPSAFGFSK